MNRKDESDGNELVSKTTFEYISKDEKERGSGKTVLAWNVNCTVPVDSGETKTHLQGTTAGQDDDKNENKLNYKWYSF